MPPPAALKTLGRGLTGTQSQRCTHRREVFVSTSPPVGGSLGPRKLLYGKTPDDQRTPGKSGRNRPPHSDGSSPLTKLRVQRQECRNLIGTAAKSRTACGRIAIVDRCAIRYYSFGRRATRSAWPPSQPFENPRQFRRRGHRDIGQQYHQFCRGWCQAECRCRCSSSEGP